MNRFIKGLVAVGVAVAVMRMVRGVTRRVAEPGLDITVTGGLGLQVQVLDGHFAAGADHWRHEHAAGQPRILQVRMTGSSCDPFPEDNRVDIHTDRGVLAIQRERQGPGGQWRACIRASDGSSPDHPSPERLLFWPTQRVGIAKVVVGDDECDALEAAIVAQLT